MGPHGGFVWSAYAVTGVVLISITLYVWLSYRASVRELDRLQPESERRSPAKR